MRTFSVPHGQEAGSKERQCVLTALRTYCWTCLVDMISLVFFILFWDVTIVKVLVKS